MTENELAAILRGLAPMVRELVTKETERHVATLHDRIVTIERGLGDDLLITMERRLGDDVLTKELGQLRDRVGAVEARAHEPGPPGPAGPAGSDGIGYDDLEAVQVDDRTFELQAHRGEHVKTIGRFRMPVDVYCGVYVDGKAYAKGDNVTYQGSVWHCNEETRERPNGGRAWTLKVKRGRDGREGHA